MTNPLSPSALAQVPEVQKALKDCRESSWSENEPDLLLAIRDAVLSAERERLLGMTEEAVPEVRRARDRVADVVRRNHQYGFPPDPRLQGDVDSDAGEATDAFDEALLAVRDAVLQAERTRLLALTPPEVVEAARLAIVGLPGWASNSCVPCNDCLRAYIETALPLLVGSERAKREAAERERDEMQEENASLTVEVARLEMVRHAAEAEVARLRGALKKYGDHDGDCVENVEANGDCDCGYSAALAEGGRDE